MQQNVDIIQQLVEKAGLGIAAITYITINNLYKEYRIIIANNIEVPYKKQLEFRKAMREAFPHRMRSNAVVFVEGSERCNRSNKFICQIKPEA